MNDLNKYYESILKKVDELYKENDFTKIINLLEDELDTPYIPEEYIKIFEEKLLEAKYNYNYNNPKNPLSNLSKIEMINHINENKEDCELAIISYFERFYDSFDSIDYEFIKNIISGNKFRNSVKIAIIQSLKIKSSKMNVDYFNPNLNEVIPINIEELILIEENTKINDIANSIKELTFSEPSLLDICYASLYSIYEFYFPKFPFDEFGAEEIAKKIIYVIKCILENKAPEVDSVTNIIFDVLKQN